LPPRSSPSGQPLRPRSTPAWRTTPRLERDARRIAAEAREKGNARLELQAIAASRAHMELMAKLASAAQHLEPEERLQRERQAEAARLVAATLGAVDELVDQGHLSRGVAQVLLGRLAERLNGMVN
jgi:hypothetical protein